MFLLYDFSNILEIFILYQLPFILEFLLYAVSSPNFAVEKLHNLMNVNVKQEFKTNRSTLYGL